MGRVRPVYVVLSRSLDSLEIRVNKKNEGRRIALVSVDEILVGMDPGDSQACEGLETPLDELSVTLALNTQECITFRMEDIESRDTLAMCLNMFQEGLQHRA